MSKGRPGHPLMFDEEIMENSTVLVLLATYNGEDYIRPMIDSLLAQDYPELRIVLSDDHSADATEAILEEYARIFPDRVTHYRSGLHFGSAHRHFLHLLSKFHDAPYIMFCDQDDVWHRDKVRKTLAKMGEIEVSGRPALVHTDLHVVDQDLKEISPSFCRYSNLDGTRLALNQLLVQNVVTGCTVMMNRPLAELASRDLPVDAILMHDWWIALLAAAFGTSAFLNENTVEYRQHGTNSVGAKDVRSPRFLWERLCSRKMRKSMSTAACQAQAFRECYSDLLTAEQAEILDAFAATQNAGILTRDRICIQYKLYKYGLVRLTAQFLGL